jgi:hypothetical protein
VARSFYVDGQATTQLAAIATAPGAPLCIVGGRTVSMPVGHFAITDAGTWVTQNDDLSLLDGNGTRLATWTGGGGTLLQPQPGALGIAKRVSVRTDGSVDVISAQSSRIERFRRR